MIQLAFVSILVGAITCLRLAADRRLVTDLLLAADRRLVTDLLLAANGFPANTMDGFDDYLLSGKLVDNFALLQR